MGDRFVQDLQLPYGHAKSSGLDVETEQEVERVKAALIGLALSLGACTAQAAAGNADFERCRVQLKQAQKIGILSELSWAPPAEPHVLAGPAYAHLSAEAQRGFANSINCFLTAGRPDAVLSFNILDAQSGKPVARYAYGKLKRK